MKDEQTGIAIRFVRQYDITADTAPTYWDFYVPEAAFQLALGDDRAVSFHEKLMDALTFLEAQRLIPRVTRPDP